MKTFLILTTVLALVQAGVRELSSFQEEEAIRLWQKICDGKSEGGVDGDAYIFCKPSQAVIPQRLHHTVIVPPNNTPRRQVIFVQPPAYQYNHVIQINGSPVEAPQASIYVLPQKNTHSFEHSYNQPATVPIKPTVHYLKSNYGSGDPGIYQTSKAGPQLTFNTPYGSPQI